MKSYQKLFQFCSIYCNLQNKKVHFPQIMFCYFDIEIPLNLNLHLKNSTANFFHFLKALTKFEIPNFLNNYSHEIQNKMHTTYNGYNFKLQVLDYFNLFQHQTLELKLLISLSIIISDLHLYSSTLSYLLFCLNKIQT